MAIMLSMPHGLCDDVLGHWLVHRSLNAGAIRQLCSPRRAHRLWRLAVFTFLRDLRVG